MQCERFAALLTDIDGGFRLKTLRADSHFNVTSGRVISLIRLEISSINDVIFSDKIHIGHSILLPHRIQIDI